MRGALADNALSVLDIYSFYLQPHTVLDDFMPALVLGAEFGARYALVQGADTDDARLRDNFAGFCERARPFGITAAIEFVPNRELATLDAALSLIRAAGQPNAVLCVDPLHLVRSGSTPADLASIDARLLPYVQFSDGILSPGEPDLALAKALGVGIRRLPGEGTLPLNAFLAALPPGIPLSVEISTPQATAMPANAWASLVLEHTRAALALSGRGA
jgi:sugar phosphate isomerase/epimerase